MPPYRRSCGDVVSTRAAFDTRRVVGTGAVELGEWDLLASLKAITQNIAPALQKPQPSIPNGSTWNASCGIRAYYEAQV